MRYVTVIALVIAASSFAPRSASARNVLCRGAPTMTRGPINCGFATLQQCLATVSGVGGSCRPNPYGAPAADARGRRYKHVRQRY